MSLIVEDYYVYIYRDANGVPFYVGKGSGNRAYEHLKGNKANPHFHRKVQKMLSDGNSPVIEIVDTPSEDHAFELEMFLISTIGRQCIGTGSLTNILEGGTQPPKVDNKGRSRSDKFKADCKTRQTGRKHSISSNEKKLEATERYWSDPDNRNTRSEKMKAIWAKRKGDQNANY